MMLVFFIGCNNKQSTVVSSSKSWAFGFVNWNNTFYKETDKKLDKVGSKIGEVEVFARDENIEYHGTFSNEYEVGSEIYSVEGFETAKAIAVKSKGDFILLIEQTLNKEDIK
ncbi:hypothetical protein [Paenibacillus azoreducens]|uniref:Uncharacterized protein n=1 Tax=Paenibacillus azoreducens TaxID=116718 RepID=A0A919YGG7_9BACL|nr:hypothetical protein [Paenibacillus azoreducens]GIO48755.1 hypothetical protein J34TS1_35200 [Paenibacillus azoreducens]